MVHVALLAKLMMTQGANAAICRRQLDCLVYTLRDSELHAQITTCDFHHSDRPFGGVVSSLSTRSCRRAFLVQGAVAHQA